VSGYQVAILIMLAIITLCQVILASRVV